MGGMTAQVVASDFPEQVLTFTSIMTSSGNPELPYGPQMMRIAEAMTKAPEPNEPLEKKVDRLVELSKLMDGPAYPQDDAVLRESIRKSLIQDAPGREPPRRSVRRPRQSAAISAVPDRRDRLGRITAPTLIIHGSDDPLYPPRMRRTRRLMSRDLRLEIIKGMGHGIPDTLWPKVADLIAQHAARARVKR